MIIFSYKISDLITEIKTLSEYGTSNIPLDRVDALENAIAIDRDDVILKSFLKYGAGSVAHIIGGYTKDLINSEGVTVFMEGLPFEFDVTYETVANSIVFRVNMPETWDENIMTMLDESIKNSLVSFSLYQLYRKKKIDFATELDDYNTSLSEIRKYIHARTVGTRRNYNMLE